MGKLVWDSQIKFNKQFRLLINWKIFMQAQNNGPYNKIVTKNIQIKFI